MEDLDKGLDAIKKVLDKARFDGKEHSVGHRLVCS
jgi:hypothetical protein